MKDKYIDLNKLQHNKSQINWIGSINSIINFKYGIITGEITIRGVDGKYLYVDYNDTKSYKISKESFINMNFGQLLKSTYNEHKFTISNVFKDDKRDLIILDKIYKSANGCNSKYYKYRCNKCGWTEGLISETNLQLGKGCSCCRGLTVVEGINDITTTASWMINYFQGGYEEAKQYTCQSGKYIYPICPDCHKISKKQYTICSIFTRKTFSCNCSDGLSYPTKFVISLLNQLKIEFIKEYSPSWALRKRYDIYDITNNIMIEIDGGFHYKDNTLSGQSFIDSNNIDELKNKLASINNFILIRINANVSTLECLKSSIINSNLSTIYNLSNIDWSLCHKDALSSLCVEAYRLFNLGYKISDISNKLKIAECTVYRHINKIEEILKCKEGVT